MELVRASIRNVAERWRSQYQQNGEWIMTATGSSREIHRALCALGPNPKAADVDRIIGNKSWTGIWCDECGNYVRKAVRVGTADLCRNCLKGALALLGKAR